MKPSLTNLEKLTCRYTIVSQNKFNKSDLQEAKSFKSSFNFKGGGHSKIRLE